MFTPKYKKNRLPEVGSQRQPKFAKRGNLARGYDRD